ncbi:MAG: gamma-glutamylcyclotransferase [Deltaproteobacteria bacterium]|nr:gamma-glutamylcyclotransferase [Deltaproteobacteria bacterium]MBW1928607.1 gamma-glutamylcyclotransferase [Deltaproteobacteria bacterium]MBW2025470.1 gamma-glutamylcyclotransferase [Deltaproteobacteria bacterium]MBW2125410.1 gamma-glutamylcyclotransferase [Deltaproteobacteria bacterium]RLB17649.1 MAG: gamma-glutamylcyclotransferase [Deltaproteobacteria bacterium]
MGGNVFTYGSLMFPEVWLRVIGKSYEKTEARLPGYQRRKVKNEPYPALISGVPTDNVEGILYLDVSTSDLASLDRFEGPFYQRIEVQCELQDGRRLPAHVYIFRGEYTHLLEDETWDPVWFAKVGLHEFLREYDGFA